MKQSNQAVWRKHRQLIHGAPIERFSRFILFQIILLALAGVQSTVSAQDLGDAVVDIHNLTSRPLRAPASFWVTSQDHEIVGLPMENFQPLTNGEINRGISRNFHWIYVRLSNEAGNSGRPWILYHETSYLDELTVYYADNNAALKSVTLADRAPFASRMISYRTLAFQHETPAGGHTDLYLRLRFHKADAMSLNFTLTRPDIFYEESLRDYVIYGIFYGVMGSLLLISLVSAVIMRQPVLLAYAAFLGTSIIMWPRSTALPINTCGLITSIGTMKASI